jgi:hypothetical protein
VLPAKNNVVTTLAQTAGTTDTSLLLVNAAQFPDKGIVVLAGNADPLINEVVYYAAKSGNSLTGCIRGFDGTLSETHVIGSMCALALIAKHVTDLQPKHGTTAERATLGASLTVDDTGRPFYDTVEDVLYEWVNDRWLTSVRMGYGPVVRDFIGTAAEVLPLAYRRGDRWTDLDSPSCAVRVCRVTTITHTAADWVAIGKQGS